MQYTKWLRGALIGGVFLSLLIPFIVANGSLSNIANWLFPASAFFPFITGKNFVFRILIEVMLGLYVLLALREPQYRPRTSYVLWAVVLFTAWAGVATIFSVDPIKSFWSNFERMEGYITIIHLLAYFFVASAMLTTEKLWTWYLRLSVAASVVMSFYGIAQLAHVIPIDQGGVRLDGTLGNSIYFAVYMLFNIFFALILMYRERENMGLSVLYGAAAVLDVLMLLFSETRGTMLGLVGGVIVAAVYFWFAAAKEPAFARARSRTLGGLAALLVLIGAFIGLRHQPFIQTIPGLDRLASISLQNSETTTRFVIWGMAWHGFLERPITGWGQENFDFVFNKYYQPQLYSQEQWFDRAHNSYVDWAVNAGVFGFVLFVALIATTLVAFMRARQVPVVERTLLVGLIVGFAIHEFFVFDNLISWLQFFTIIALAHALARREVPRALWASRPVMDRGVAVAAPIVAVAVIGGAWYLNAPGIAGATTLIKALQPATAAAGSTGLAQNLAYFKQALGDGPLGRQEITEQLLTAATSVATSQSASPDMAQAYSDAALAAIGDMTRERPHDARLELFYGSFLDQLGQPQKALDELNAAHADSPNKQQILFEIGVDTYLRAGDTKDALAPLKMAYELDPSYDQARIYYALALYSNGQTADADKLLIDRYGTVEVDNDTLVSAFVQTKQYARAEDILKTRVGKDSTDVQSWVQLASIYYASGDRQNTIATLKAAAAANPGSASQINQLITQVEQAH